MFEIVHGEGVLKFEGSKVASVSTELPSKQRWSEFDLYVSRDGEFILSGVGKSRVPGEQDRAWSVISDDPLDILDSLLGKDASRPAKRLLAESLLALMASGPALAPAS